MSFKFDELDKVNCKCDELAKLKNEFVELDNVRMSSMSSAVSLMSLLS